LNGERTFALAQPRDLVRGEVLEASLDVVDDGERGWRETGRDLKHRSRERVGREGVRSERV